MTVARASKTKRSGEVKREHAGSEGWAGKSAVPELSPGSGFLLRFSGLNPPQHRRISSSPEHQGRERQPDGSEESFDSETQVAVEAVRTDEFRIGGGRVASIRPG
jgi:hypothetical protein